MSGYGQEYEGGLPSPGELFSTGRQPDIGETAEEVRRSLGIGARRIRQQPADGPDVAGLAEDLGLA